MKIISLWSGPRNVSTALMYSFLEHPLIEAIDEPLYAHYLSRTEVRHPGDSEVLATMEHDGEKVLNTIVASANQYDVLFLKNMAHHWIDLSDQWLAQFENIFLIRDPREMLPSLVNQLPNPVLRDTGLDKQKYLYDLLKAQDKTPVIIDSKHLLKNPEKILRSVCKHLDLNFDLKMLKWRKGERQQDGIWAKHWYHNVHKSEGFSPYYAKEDPVPDHLSNLLAECDPFYQYLTERSIKS